MVTFHIRDWIADQLILSGIAQVQCLSAQGDLFSQQTVDCQKRNRLISSFTNRPVLKCKTNLICGLTCRKGKMRFMKSVFSLRMLILRLMPSLCAILYSRLILMAGLQFGFLFRIIREGVWELQLLIAGSCLPTDKERW